jgi:hypothetical protein
MDVVLIVNFIGWLGSAAVIVAYVLVSTNRLRGDAVAYQLLNLIGGIFLALNTAYLGAYLGLCQSRAGTAPINSSERSTDAA